MSRAPLPLYRSPLLAELTQGLLRPGGLELTQRGLALAELPAGARVLDVGSGLGATVALLCQLGLDARGCDLDPERVRQAAARHPGMPFSVASALALPFADASFDAVFFECTLSVVADPAAALREAHRVLGARGALIVSDVIAREPRALADARAAWGGCGASLLSMEQLAHHLASSGFELGAWLDQSPALAALMGQLIFRSGSTRPFWELTCHEPGGAAQAERLLRAARPGYVLLMARRAEETRA